MAEVVLERITKLFPNGVTAVRDLSLTVGDGEFLTLVGPSGCGKTTTLRLIAGLERPTQGAVRLAGRDATQLPPRDRDVALVFQRHSLYPHLSVRDNLAFGLRLRHSAGWLAQLRPSRRADLHHWNQVIDERVAEMARLLELDKVLDHLPTQLSGGQQQRAALGRALVRQPAVLLLDEPLSHLDMGLRAEMRRHLHLLHRRLQATIIYVTHDQVEAMTLGDRLVVLDRGVLQQAGPPVQVYRHPRTRLVAGFLGWPPMNFLDGRLVPEEGRLAFTGGGLKLPMPDGLAAPLGPYVGRPIIFGIRPEHVIWPGDRRRSVCLTAEVVLVELLGSDRLVTLQKDDWRFMAKSAGQLSPEVGEAVEVGIEMEQAHWFDQASGLALRLGDPAG